MIFQVADQILFIAVCPSHKEVLSWAKISCGYLRSLWVCVPNSVLWIVVFLYSSFPASSPFLFHYPCSRNLNLSPCASNVFNFLFFFIRKVWYLILCLKQFWLLDGWKPKSCSSIPTEKIVLLHPNKLGVKTITRFIKSIPWK